MPRLKMSSMEQANRRLLEAVKGASAFYDITSDEQASIAGVSRATWYRRLQHPGEFTLNELRRMARQYHWDDKVLSSILRV